MKVSRLALSIAFLGLVPAVSLAQHVYPAQGQNQERQQKDQGECHTWAVNQSGYNPGYAQQPTQGGVVRGGARGAATGAVVGAIAGDAGKGAAAGAAGGALIGGMRRRDAERQQNAAADSYQRAYAACLQGRGYTVQ
jgi:hypothetical protein